MDNKDKKQEITLEDIIREFGSDWLNEDLLKEEAAKSATAVMLPKTDGETVPEAEETAPEVIQEVIPEEAESEEAAPETVVIDAAAEEAPAVSTDDTIRLDSLDMIQPAQEEAEEPAVSRSETQVLPELPDKEEPAEAEEAPNDSEEEAAPGPKPIRFRSKLAELKHKLVTGPEKRYYDLLEIGLSRIQIAIFLSFLIVLLCAGGTAMYTFGMVMENRLRLMVFSQILAMMISALLGCYVLLDGIMDLFTGRFSLNTMLFLTLAACSADAVFCLQELRVPCCAAFSLEMAFALWNRCLRRSTEMGQMDTLRKANRLDGVVKVPDHMGNGPAILRTEGRVEDFMEHYHLRTGPEKTLNIFALFSVLACIGIAVLAGIRHGLSLAIQVFSTSMLVAIPASAFISQSRPAAILERRLHMVGTVICGWQGVKSLCGKASFPLFDKDLFPVGSIRLNGVKFLGDREPEGAIAAATALIRQRGGNLEPIFTQLLKNRGGRACDVDNFRVLPGGVAGLVEGDNCLLGLRDCLKEHGVEIPEAALVNNAVYFAVDGILVAVFVLNFSRTRAAAGGLVTLGGYRKLRPMILCRNFMITPQLIREKFGIKPRRYDFPDPEVRDEFASFVPDPKLISGALTTQQNLSSMAYAVTGARTLRSSSRAGLVLHVFAGIVGLLIMAALAYLGNLQLLSPFNILMYQLVWLIPGLLVTEWARTV